MLGPVLEVPTTYQSFNELAEEFANLISNKDPWGFTIVWAFHFNDDPVICLVHYYRLRQEHFELLTL